MRPRDDDDTTVRPAEDPLAWADGPSERPDHKRRYVSPHLVCHGTVVDQTQSQPYPHGFLGPFSP